jgi:hypothetical protein
MQAKPIVIEVEDDKITGIVLSEATTRELYCAGIALISAALISGKEDKLTDIERLCMAESMKYNALSISEQALNNIEIMNCMKRIVSVP